MKPVYTISFFFILIIISSQIISQNRFNSCKYTLNSKITKLTKVDTNLQNFPFRFGAEFAALTAFDNPAKVYPALFGFLDINLSRKIAFLKLELGTFAASGSTSERSIYSSIGINYKIIDSGKNKFFIHGGVFIGYGVSPFLSLRYLLAFNKFFGIVSSLRYPAGGFNAFLFSTGIQFFTN